MAKGETHLLRHHPIMYRDKTIASSKEKKTRLNNIQQ